MTTITCDMCKTTIEEASRYVNYFTIRDLDVCKPCKKQFDRDIQDAIEEKRPYTLKLHMNTMWSNMARACGRE
ncbi:MAG: hypothetical protein E4H36_06930 [Spirochaetales bacterium]|nr:MAG: hypothetical protein E4H36_06930 [Spirochaetales bacterium]